MKWGKPWGASSLWGVDDTGPADYCALADERVLAQMDDTPGTRNFRDLICVLAEPMGEYSDVLAKILDAFDLSNAVGEQLDFIGRIVGLPRSGATDVRYRTFIEIQTELLLAATREDANWTGTVNNILTICRKFIGAGPDPITYTPAPPYHFLLDVPGITISEMLVLIRFIKQALYASVLGETTFILAPNSLWNTVHPVPPITDGGIWDTDEGSVVIPGATVWGHTIAIGLYP